MKDIVTLDRDVRSQGVQVHCQVPPESPERGRGRNRFAEIGICKEISNFTSALENLDLETNRKDHVEFKTSEAQTDYCNDSEQEEIVPIFKTREISTFQLVIYGPEILNFQGTRHSPADIAPYWKKDSRMWLWKSVRLARKIRRTKAKAVTPTGTLNDKELS